MITLSRAQVDEIYAHAREVEPNECCGLIGGVGDTARSVYHMRNVSREALVAYEAAPEDIFDAQRQMRSRREELLAIYHSHPRSSDPTPSQTDVRLAYYPSAIYFIIGLETDEPTMRAFRISEREQRWEPQEFTISDS
jgi:proteasome lid subunit RPN8/RPN11